MQRKQKSMLPPITPQNVSSRQHTTIFPLTEKTAGRAFILPTIGNTLSRQRKQEIIMEERREQPFLQDRTKRPFPPSRGTKRALQRKIGTFRYYPKIMTMMMMTMHRLLFSIPLQCSSLAYSNKGKWVINFPPPRCRQHTAVQYKYMNTIIIGTCTSVSGTEKIKNMML